MQSVPAGSPAAEEKRRLRKELRTLRQALDASALGRAAGAVRAAAAALGALPAARTVAGYVACDGEVDVAPLLDDARRRGAVVLLPRRAHPLLELVLADPAAAHVARAGAGMLEPTGPACDLARLASPAIAFVPAVALDRRGHRLGRGGGDYDRLLPTLRALGWTIVGVCHASQLRDTLPTESHDQPVDAILTDAGLLLPHPLPPHP